MVGALALGHSNKVLNIFMAILDDDIDKKKHPKSLRNSSAERSFSEILGLKLDCFSASWNDEDMEKVVSYLQEWNTNAKHSFVSQAVLSRYVRPSLFLIFR